VVIGEGEVTSVELAQALEGEKSLSEVKGIGYKENGMIKIIERRPFIQDLDNYAVNWDLVDIHRYIGPWGGLKRVLQFVTSRGCPHQCGFCYNLEFNQRKWRAHSVDFVVSQILQLKQRYDLKGVRFWDDNFFANKTRAFEIIERIDMPYYAEARIDYVDEEFARKLAETKCIYLLTGIESGSDRILKMINKNVSVSQIKESVKTLAKYPLVRVSGSIIFAYPTEKQDEFLSTIRLIVDLLDIKSYMDFTTGFYMPYPGSDLYELAVKEGFKPPARTEDWEDLDRWADKHEITWVDWISSAETAQIRKNIQLLGFLHQYSIPFLKGMVKKRILVGNGHLCGLSMRLLVWLHSTFYSGKHPIFNFVRRNIVPILWKIRQIRAQAHVNISASAVSQEKVE
jgi:radical SAM superfamily enzyme YgiQ (UPF0313 family)